MMNLLIDVSSIDCYQIGDTIVEEKEYAKYKV